MRGLSCFGCDSETCEATLGLTLLCPAINKAGCEEPQSLGLWPGGSKPELLVLLAQKGVGCGKGK